ncbi:hypothetical protein AC579_980 [Pseudocercospora musae]|uniref:Extracellular membrane protein CFEM domain-containing protein n=1 Tax=Pseudocercospora musae TaxID=113226 RepID=A0A139I1T4_9PEZI|nr:hypothetical protein AC579_980 [Pseudocercospora musae]
MRFSTLATLFALIAGALAQYPAIAQGSNYESLACSKDHLCKAQGNGCIPHDTNNDGTYDSANCS